MSSVMQQCVLIMLPEIYFDVMPFKSFTRKEINYMLSGYERGTYSTSPFLCCFTFGS